MVSRLCAGGPAGGRHGPNAMIHAKSPMRAVVVCSDV
jgi:hypothetical protein